MTKLSDVNTTDIVDAIRLACRNMCSCFDPEDHDFPYWQVDVLPKTFLAKPFEHENPGRHLPPIFMADELAGVPVDEDCVAKHTNSVMFSYGAGALPLPLRRAEDEEFNVIDKDSLPTNMGVHSHREGIHALWALTKYRHSDRARELAEASVATILQYWEPGEEWDYDRLERDHGVTARRPRSFINGLARAIGPLVKFYAATGHGPALELATMLKEKAVAEFYLEDGSHDPDRFSTHSHSTTCVMSSLAQLADVTSDSTLMSRVKSFYDRGLWDLRDEVGWSPENSGYEKYTDRGEINNSADILETALILGRWGYPECYHDAERILRCHILPSQLRDVSWIPEPPNPEGLDGLRDVADRLRGTWGFPAPYGHQPVDFERVSYNLDVVGGGALALCEAYKAITRYSRGAHWVDLLFDRETPEIKVESPYTHPTLQVTLKRAGPLFVRVPPWVDHRKLDIRGDVGTPRSTNGYLLVSNAPVNRPISFEFPLPTQEITLTHREKKIRARLRGDEVVAMENLGAPLTFFDPLD